MTALAPLPPPEPTEVDLGAELEGLRRRSDDHAAHLRKHQASVTQLADSVAALVALGRQRNRWINLNSFVAYVLFTMLLGGGMYVLYRSRVAELEARRGQAVAERDLARAQAQAQAPAHDDATAAALYALVKSGDRAGLLAREPELATAALTATERAVFADAIAAIQTDGAGDGKAAAAPAAAAAAATPGDDGIAAFKAGQWAAAAKALERALANAPADRVAQLRYYLGASRWKLGQHKAAAAQLGQALAGTLDASAVDARYLYAASLDKVGAFEQARGEYDRFASAHPQHPLAVYARRRSATLLRRARAAAAPPAAETEPTAPGAGSADAFGGSEAPEAAPQTAPPPASPSPTPP
jgi:hypothetical protein